jgi:hypothetical protein
MSIVEEDKSKRGKEKEERRKRTRLDNFLVGD